LTVLSRMFRTGTGHKPGETSFSAHFSTFCTFLNFPHFLLGIGGYLGDSLGSRNCRNGANSVKTAQNGDKTGTLLTKREHSCQQGPSFFSQRMPERRASLWPELTTLTEIRRASLWPFLPKNADKTRLVVPLSYPKTELYPGV